MYVHEKYPTYFLFHVREILENGVKIFYNYFTNNSELIKRVYFVKRTFKTSILKR